MTFKCSVCGEPQKLIKNSGSSFYDIAYDDIIEWSDFNSIQEVPDINEKVWERSDIMPRAGTDRIVRACFPFNFEIGDTFHVLFMPALSFFNGWDEYPEEIDGSAVVKCRFDRIISYNEEKAWIVVHIISSVPLKNLCQHYPQTVTEKFYEPVNNKYASLFEYGCWSIYDDPYEDWGSRYLFFTDSNMEKHLVLACRWDHHISEIRCCNIVLGTPESLKVPPKNKSYAWKLKTVWNGHLSCKNYNKEDTVGEYAIKLLIEKKFGGETLRKNHVSLWWDIWSGLSVMSGCGDGDILVKKIYEYLCRPEDDTDK